MLKNKGKFDDIDKMMLSDKDNSPELGKEEQKSTT